MYRDRQGQVRDPGQHGQRHQTGFCSVVDKAGFAARPEPAYIAAHQTVDQTDKCRRENQRQRERQDQQAHQKVSVVKAAAIR